MNWYFITIAALSGIGLITTLLNKKTKLKSKIAGAIGYITFMVLIAMAINIGW